MKHIKNINEFFDFFKKKSDPHKDQRIKNEEILRSIVNIEPNIQIHEGEFKPSTWLRNGDLLPMDQRNDELITTYAGMSLSYDLVKKVYELSLPVKFNDEFKSRISNLIKSKFTILNGNPNVRVYPEYTKTIIFKDES